MQRSVLPVSAAYAASPKPFCERCQAPSGNSSAPKSLLSLRASRALLQEYSRQVSSKSQTAGVPDLPRAGRRRGTQKSPHAIAA